MEHDICTSLQAIVTDHCKETRQQQLAQLFHRKSYQVFSLPQPKGNSALHQHPIFRFFVNVLKEWNSKVNNNTVASLTEVQYHRHRFIYDTIKNAVVHHMDPAIRMLEQLEEWYNKDRKRSIKYFPTKPQQFSINDEEWDLRNTFKSNLPTEIDNYKRKIVDSGCDKMNRMTLQPIDKWKKVRTEAYCDEQEEYQQMISNQRLIVMRNNKIRTQREKGELNSMQKLWKARKIRREQIGIKSYYDGRFLRDKKMNIKEGLRKSRPIDDLITIKKPRSNLELIKNSKPISTRPSEKSMNSGFTTSKSLSRNSATERGTAFEPKMRSQKQNVMQFEYRAQSIDGMRLMTNPFQTAMKKKKRNA